ncbi:helix-turn-helix domain-containing protein [Alicyclobacillus macrosporangiidus]|uniref:helix-turn-helix domain-containing protein n=1 Tax=Alicyclobacillus macrosporangiidus TaxID=392015 RepID=UPI000496FA84|nr:helix-turn-helix transcriptional regulator [Alicyclobacillus macrosporangiidus]
MPSIGEKIREIRLQRGMTQSDLGEGLVSSSMISQIEADRTRPSYPLLTALANRLGMPVEYFLDDLGDKFTLQAYLRLGEYFVRRQQPARAVEALQAAPTPETPGLMRQDYLLSFAQAWRGVGDTQRATACLEELREHALRAQDQRLLFHVRKEAGRLEYDMGNLDGAMHEWRKALELGEELAQDDPPAPVMLRADMGELCLSLYTLHAQRGEWSAALSVLQRGAELCREFTRLHDVADALVNEAQSVIDHDAVRAKDAVDRAVALLDGLRLAELYVALQTRLSQHGHGPEPDAWNHAARATVAAAPGPFLDAELFRVDRLLQTGDVDEALRRLDRCASILEDYAKEPDAYPRWVEAYRIRIEAARAMAEYQKGEVDGAVDRMLGVADALQRQDSAREAAAALAQVMMWYTEQGREDLVEGVSQRIETLLDASTRPV